MQITVLEVSWYFLKASWVRCCILEMCALIRHFSASIITYIPIPSAIRSLKIAQEKLTSSTWTPRSSTQNSTFPLKPKPSTNWTKLFKPQSTRPNSKISSSNSTLEWTLLERRRYSYTWHKNFTHWLRVLKRGIRTFQCSGRMIGSILRQIQRLGLFMRLWSEKYTIVWRKNQTRLELYWLGGPIVHIRADSDSM